MLAYVLHARFADASEQRASDRKVLRLEAPAATPAGDGDIQILNLSRTGMLVGSATGLTVGAAIEVEMPGGTRHRAEVVWQDTDLIGCRFSKPLSQATLSAALLRSAPASPSDADVSLVVDKGALARLSEHWDFEHEVAEAREPGLALGTRLWVIIGLGLASWAIPTAVVAWLLA